MVNAYCGVAGFRWHRWPAACAGHTHHPWLSALKALPAWNCATLCADWGSSAPGGIFVRVTRRRSSWHLPHWCHEGMQKTIRLRSLSYHSTRHCHHYYSFSARVMKGETRNESAQIAGGCKVQADKNKTIQWPDVDYRNAASRQALSLPAGRQWRWAGDDCG